MPREYSRTVRVAEQLRRELALLIQQEVKDPRVGMATVSDVEVSPDLGHARVYVTVLDDGESAETSIAALNRAAGYLRRELGRRLVLRTIPRLRFYHDRTSVEGTRLSALIDHAVHGDERAKGN
ncbi:MAG TPA: 30S ribosome-binding factor RbfA [Gammaproteobacteria bacterium]|nr:30S ribosome-binding factor RbfA [Gammaproteobacteria bacterium]